MKRARIGAALGKLKTRTSFPRGITMKGAKAKNDEKELLNENFITESPCHDPYDCNAKISLHRPPIKNLFQSLKKSCKSNSSDSSDTSSLDSSDEAFDGISVLDIFTCSSPERFDHQEELLMRINKLQSELNDKNDIVAGLNKELVQVCTERDDAIFKLSQLMKDSKRAQVPEHAVVKAIYLTATDKSAKSDLTDDTTLPFYRRSVCSCLNN